MSGVSIFPSFLLPGNSDISSSCDMMLWDLAMKSRFFEFKNQEFPENINKQKLDKRTKFQLFGNNVNKNQKLNQLHTNWEQKFYPVTKIPKSNWMKICYLNSDDHIILILLEYICDALRDLVPLVQFKKREKHPWKSVNFTKVAGFYF